MLRDGPSESTTQFDSEPAPADRRIDDPDDLRIIDSVEPWIDTHLMEPTDADPPVVREDEDGSGQVRSSEAEAAYIEGAPFLPFQPRRLGQEGDVVPRVPTGPTAPPASDEGAETEDEGEGED